MFKPLIVISSLAIPSALPPVQSYGPRTQDVYIMPPSGRPVLPEWDSTYPTRPMSNEDIIKQQLENIIYQDVIRQLQE